jgi:hypothetical protein
MENVMHFLTHLHEALAAYKAGDHWSAIRHLLHVAAEGADSVQDGQSFAPGTAVCPVSMPSFQSDDEALAALEAVAPEERSFSLADSVPWAVILPLALDVLKRLLNRVG